MAARLTQRRLFLCAAAIVALVSVTTACGGGGDAQAAPKDPPLAQYKNSTLSFSYPASWTASKPTLPPEDLHFHPIVFLSTQPVHAPCTTTGNETDCSLPLDQLQAGGVFAMWQPAEGPPVTPAAPFHGTLRVGGHPAQRNETQGGECKSIGAERTISVEVESAPEDYIFFTACLRGPGLARAEKSVDALLASTKFTAP
jgi:hypothetical protein